jgi:peptide/nickel transport system substrate-binding protein
MFLRNTRPPFDNLKFRQALEYAIDKDALNKGLYDGNCEPTTQFYRPEHWAHSATVDKRYTYNHDLAQQMIKDSGIFNPTFTLVYGALYAPPAQALQGILGDYGINVKLQVTASTDTSFRDGQADATVTGFSGQVDPSALITTYYLPNGVYKLAADPDGSITRDATAAADPTISQAASAKLYDSVWQKLTEQAITVHLCNSRQIWIHKGKVANLDQLAATWAGIADSRFLYVKK